MRLETCRVGVAELYSAGRDYAVPVWICDQFATAVVTTLRLRYRCFVRWFILNAARHDVAETAIGRQTLSELVDYLMR